MTFLEAAIEILRSESEPLHYAEIARRAVERKLLSHVGRDPETAMKTCLTSAVKPEDAAIERAKPGYYQLKESARQTPPAAPSKPAAPAKSSENNTVKEAVVSTASDSTPKTTSSTPVPASEPAASTPGGGESKARVSFAAPAGSGLEGVTDVALVMANAMSRLADERPELRDELLAMQAARSKTPNEVEPARPGNDADFRGRRPGPHKPGAAPRPIEVVRLDAAGRREDAARKESREDSGPLVEEKASRRRRRRRRKRGRAEWGDLQRAAGGRSEEALDHIVRVMEEAGGRSMHVRQIAEALAAQGLLSTEVSELERMVTSSILLDVHELGISSRFYARGDARYQLRSGRLPEALAKAEKAFRTAHLDLEREARQQLVAWVSGLGVRALEALVRVWLAREGASLVTVLPPGKGVARLVVEEGESEDEAVRTLVVILPRRTGLDARHWEGEPEKLDCTSVTVVWTGEGEPSGDVRHVPSDELAEWMMRNRIGTTEIGLQALSLDPVFLESIGGLDT